MQNRTPSIRFRQPFQQTFCKQVHPTRNSLKMKPLIPCRRAKSCKMKLPNRMTKNDALQIAILRQLIAEQAANLSNKNRNNTFKIRFSPLNRLGFQPSRRFRLPGCTACVHDTAQLGEAHRVKPLRSLGPCLSSNQTSSGKAPIDFGMTVQAHFWDAGFNALRSSGRG